MDILKYINSKDIRNHLENIGYEFNSLEAEWLIYQCKDLSIKEKHIAWQELIETMPDCRIEKRLNTIPQDSLHEFLREYMRLEDMYIQEFCREDTNGEYVYTFEYIYGKNGSREGETVFSSFNAITKKLELEDDETAVRVTRVQMNEMEIGKQTALLDPQFNFMEIIPGRIPDKRDKDIFYMVFDGLWFDIPTPFKKGDILWNPEHLIFNYAKCGEPFVLTNIITDKGFLKNENEKFVREMGDHIDMAYYGYYVMPDKGMYMDHMIAYTDLEYFSGELEGVERILKSISEFLRGEMELERCCQLYHKIMAESNGWVAPYIDSIYLEDIL